jgi:elongation factor P
MMADDIQATALRRGTAIIHEGVPYRVLEFEHRTPGNKRGFVQTKIRNLLDGTQREVKFSTNDSVERAIIEAREMDYLYPESDGGVFMDVQSYEQLTVRGDMFADAAPWLSEGMRVLIELLDGRPIGLQLPKAVEIGIKETEPVIKGQTAAKSNKPAVLENGVTIQVPTFLGSGDRIRVDPGELRYIERAK